MGRKRITQKRIGKKEQRKINILIAKLKTYRIFSNMKKQRENEFNNRLMDHLRQNPNPLEVNNVGIPAPVFVGETFRPEFYLGSKKKPLCAVECKRLTEHTAKARWKEALSQTLLYSEIYKSVIAVLLDFTSDARYHRAFGKGNNPETRFAKRLREQENIQIIVLKPAN